MSKNFDFGGNLGKSQNMAVPKLRSTFSKASRFGDKSEANQREDKKRDDTLAMRKSQSQYQGSLHSGLNVNFSMR